jgi:hypothetical protein
VSLDTARHSSTAYRIVLRRYRSNPSDLVLHVYKQGLERVCWVAWLSVVYRVPPGQAPPGPVYEELAGLPLSHQAPPLVRGPSSRTAACKHPQAGWRGLTIPLVPPTAQLILLQPDLPHMPSFVWPPKPTLLVSRVAQGVFVSPGGLGCSCARKCIDRLE